MSTFSRIPAFLAACFALLVVGISRPAHSQDIVRPGMLARKIPSPHDPSNPIFRDQAKRENCARVEEDTSGDAHCIPQMRDAAPSVTPKQ